MSSALATKTSTPLVTIFPFVSSSVESTGFARVGSLAFRQRHLRPGVGTQLRQLGSGPQARPQASATAPREPASSKNEGRLSVLDLMGANRTTKLVIIVFLSVYGTMETFFYANAAYRYFSKDDDE
ncbi:hypothetical protein diail_11225 [Diaporthe ilicicola]|nr:hypothetical protein diail_11225 [Diaporthe ilicicola]